MLLVVKKSLSVTASQLKQLVAKVPLQFRHVVSQLLQISTFGNVLAIVQVLTQIVPSLKYGSLPPGGDVPQQVSQVVASEHEFNLHPYIQQSPFVVVVASTKIKNIIKIF